MIDSHSIPLWTRVFTSTGTQVFTGECELVRLIFPTGRPTTDTVTIYNSAGTNVGTFGVFKADGNATFLQPASVEIGAIFGTGIRVKPGTLEPLVVVYRGRTA